MTGSTEHSQQGAAAAPSLQLAAVIGEFETPEALIAAAEKVREAGYTRFDAHSPFPIHGIDDAIGIRPTVVPWLTLGGAFAGVITALVMQFVLNSVWYQFLISGKPIVSVPSMMPVTFELGVLFAAFATLGSMLALNGLPFFSPPTVTSERFRRSTSDKFFITLDARDPRFSSAGANALLQSAGASAVEECWNNPCATRIPQWFWLTGVLAVCCFMIPPALVGRQKVVDKREPKIHLIQDMDFQPKFKAQRENPFFADNRANRPQVAGTVPRGFLEDNDPLYRGLPADSPALPVVMTSFQSDGAAAAPAGAADGAQPADGAKPADGAQPAAAAGAADGAGTPAPGTPPDPLDSLPWITEFPIPVTAETMARGQERYNIYCAQCHGLGGDGDGLVTLRALALEQGTWVRPVSYHNGPLRNQAVGRLFHSITNGVRKMPAMGDLISAEDRWAILLYVRALQRSRNGTLSDVPADLVPQLQDLK
jgi:mono/diheme cytochrome c family protein